jgi:hypothetical protein
MHRRKAPRRQSLREKLIENRRGLELWSFASGKPTPPELLTPIPEKRAYTKRLDGSSEHKEQSAVVDWWDKQCGAYGLPHFALFAVPNGAYLASGFYGAAKLKAEGMRRGALDLILAKPTARFSGLFIEMKYGKNKASDDQEAMKNYLIGAGYYATVKWSADDAIATIKEYLAA